MNLEYENLLGKPWVINSTDCFTLVRDFYKQNFEIEIPNFARPNDWNADKLDLIGLLYKKAGFIKVIDWDDLRPADILAVAIGSTNPNSFTIYVGDNKIVHHKYGVNSCEETMRPVWRMATAYILRHPDVPDLRPHHPDITIEELLRARFRI